jgi:glycosyltransferase involved in cell wall biosynthesis
MPNQQRPLSVCMLTSRFPPDHGGGALQAMRLCHKLAERQVRTFVISGHMGGQIIAEHVEGIAVTRLPLSAHGGLALLPVYAKRLARLLARRHDYDLIHAHAIHHHAYAGFLAARLLGKPAIAVLTGMHADTPARIRQRRLGGLQQRCLSLATRLIALSQELYEQAVQEGIPTSQLVRIPNGVDTHLFRPVDGPEQRRLRQTLGLPQEALIAVFVGAVRHIKGLDVLAKAWPTLATTLPDLHLYLVGPYRQQEHWELDPVYNDELQRLFACTATGRLHFVGQVSHVATYMQAADLFVFPSRSEGMPNALLEAMACGLPFVATRLGCMVEMAPLCQQPYLVPVDDVAALTQAFFALAQDVATRRRLGAAARQMVEQHWSLDAVADRYVELYHQLLEKS